jgi:hypothetical protein
MMHWFLLFLKLWPLIKPILPELLRVIDANKHLLDKKLKRPETTSREDLRDFAKDAEWDPFTPEWEKD